MSNGNKVIVYFKGKRVTHFYSAASSELTNHLIAVEIVARDIDPSVRFDDITISVR